MRPPEQFSILTPREQQVAAYLAQGSTNREIAELLSIALKTVDTHRSHLLKKLQISNNVKLSLLFSPRQCAHCGMPLTDVSPDKSVHGNADHTPASILKLVK